MKRKCKLLAILTTAILLLSSAAATAEMIVIIEDIPMGELYLPTVVAENSKQDDEIEFIGAPAGDDELIIYEDDVEDGDDDEIISAPLKPMAEDEEWITPPQIMAEEEEELIVAPVAPSADDEMTFEGDETGEQQTIIADVSISYNGDMIFLGDTVTLTASVEDGASVQWQQQRPGQGWTNMAGENSATLYIVVTGDNAENNWRCLVAA